ncbi:hypothetical protein [Umezawaea sp.]|uniref:hypothetical protein n=1 Tax=Umezawaea sp. TaxID=1955258 RepID=UPI002ED0BF45
MLAPVGIIADITAVALIPLGQPRQIIYLVSVLAFAIGVTIIFYRRNCTVDKLMVLEISIALVSTGVAAHTFRRLSAPETESSCEKTRTTIDSPADNTTLSATQKANFSVKGSTNSASTCGTLWIFLRIRNSTEAVYYQQYGYCVVDSAAEKWECGGAGTKASPGTKVDILAYLMDSADGRALVDKAAIAKCSTGEDNGLASNRPPTNDAPVASVSVVVE